MTQIAVGALLLVVSIVLAVNKTWVAGLGRLVDIPEEEYPRRWRESSLFPKRYRIFQLNFAALLFITGLVFIAGAVGL